MTPPLVLLLMLVTDPEEESEGKTESPERRNERRNASGGVVWRIPHHPHPAKRNTRQEKTFVVERVKEKVRE